MFTAAASHTVLQPGHGFLWRTNQQNRQSNQFTFENAFARRGKPRFLFCLESHMQVLRTTFQTIGDFSHIGQHFNIDASNTPSHIATDTLSVIIDWSCKPRPIANITGAAYTSTFCESPAFGTPMNNCSSVEFRTLRNSGAGVPLCAIMQQEEEIQIFLPVDLTRPPHTLLLIRDNKTTPTWG